MSLALAKASGDEPSVFFTRSILSPAQAEKLIGKKNVPAGLIVAQSSGLKLVRDTDPSALPLAAAFPALET